MLPSGQSLEPSVSLPADVDALVTVSPAEPVVETFEDHFLVCAGLGGGRARQMACSAEHAKMKLIPWGGVAAWILRNGAPSPPLTGRAFCFLPLPVQIGLPVHVSGMPLLAVAMLFFNIVYFHFPLFYLVLRPG